MYDNGQPIGPLPPTQKQLDYARTIARRLDQAIPHASLSDRRALSRWIDHHKAHCQASHSGASSRQVAFAEKLARIKRRAIPDECFKDAKLMSRWIDANR